MSYAVYGKTNQLPRFYLEPDTSMRISGIEIPKSSTQLPEDILQLLSDVSLIRDYGKELSQIRSIMFSMATCLSSMLVEMEKIRKIEGMLKNIENSLMIRENDETTDSYETANVSDINIDEKKLEHLYKEKAKEMIIKLFEKEGELSYSDIMDKLNIDLELIIDICAELEDEKQIEGI